MGKSSKSNVITPTFHHVMGGRPDTPVCVCGHDIFYHDLNIHPTPVDCIEEMDRLVQADSITGGKCNEHAPGSRYTCKCKQFNSIDMWLNELWKEFEEYDNDIETSRTDS